MKVLLVIVAFLLFVASCASEAFEPQPVEDPAEFVSERLQSEENSPQVGGASTTTIPQVRGAVVNQYSLKVGDCFNALERFGVVDVTTTLIDCDLPHDRQIYFLFDYPAPYPSIYPGDKVMTDYAVQFCYHKFESWVGTAYETSALDIGVTTPTKTNFENDQAPYRKIHCYLERFDGQDLIGDAYQSRS